jgi:hypothetical protein
MGVLQEGKMRPPIHPHLKHENDLTYFEWPQKTAGTDKRDYAAELFEGKHSTEPFEEWDW